MKLHMLYAPALLLSLSVACGKGNKEEKRDLANPTVQLTAEQQSKVDSIVASNPVAPLADEVTPVTPVVNAPAPVTNNTTVASPSAPVTAVPNAPVLPEAPVEAPANGVEVIAPIDTAPLAATTLSSGVVAIDAICNKPFAAFDALIANDIAAFEALKLTAQSNTTCYNLLVSSTGGILEELEALGYPNLGLGASIPLNKATWGRYAADQGTVLFLQDFARQIMTDERNNNLADASEELRYIELSLAEINAIPDAEFTADDQRNYVILLSSYEVQAKLVNRITTRIAKFESVINFMDLGLIVSQIGQILQNPPVAPTAPAQPVAEQPTTPAGNVSSPTEGGETPVLDPSVPDVAPEPVAPTPVP